MAEVNKQTSGLWSQSEDSKDEANITALARPQGAHGKLGAHLR